MADINGVLERLVKYKILVVEGPGKDAFCAVGLAMGPKKCIKFISTVSLHIDKRGYSNSEGLIFFHYTVMHFDLWGTTFNYLRI